MIFRKIGNPAFSPEFLGCRSLLLLKYGQRSRVKNLVYDLPNKCLLLKNNNKTQYFIKNKFDRYIFILYDERVREEGYL